MEEVSERMNSIKVGPQDESVKKSLLTGEAALKEHVIK